MSQRQTNVEFLTDLMEFSPLGPLTQAFIVHTLHVGARQIADDPNPSRFDSAVLDGTYWQQIAKHVADRMDEFYGSYDRNTPATD